jgi:hypothetical protein
VKPPQPASPISAESLARAAQEGAGEQAAQADVKPASGAIPPPIQSQPSPEEPVEPAKQREPAVASAEPEVQKPFSPADDGVSQPFPDAEVRDDSTEVVPTLGDPSEIIEVSFDAETGEEPTEPPEVKRVQVSNQMDILAELDGLRKQATMRISGRESDSPSPELDLDSLISSDREQTRELRRKIEKAVNSDIFKTMRGMQIAIRLQNEGGDTIHSFDPVSLDIEDATALKKLCLRFSLDLENLR